MWDKKVVKGQKALTKIKKVYQRNSDFKDKLRQVQNTYY